MAQPSRRQLEQHLRALVGQPGPFSEPADHGDGRFAGLAVSVVITKGAFGYWGSAVPSTGLAWERRSLAGVTPALPGGQPGVLTKIRMVVPQLRNAPDHESAVGAW